MARLNLHPITARSPLGAVAQIPTLGDVLVLADGKKEIAGHGVRDTWTYKIATACVVDRTCLGFLYHAIQQ